MNKITYKILEEALEEIKKCEKNEDYENIIQDLIFTAGTLGTVAKPIIEILKRTSEEIKNGNCKDPKNDLEFSIIMLEKMKEQKRQNDIRVESQKVQDEIRKLKARSKN